MVLDIIVVFVLFIAVGYFITSGIKDISDKNYFGSCASFFLVIIFTIFGTLMFFYDLKPLIEHNAIEKYIEGNVEIHDTIIDGEIVKRTYKILNDIDYD